MSAMASRNLSGTHTGGERPYRLVPQQNKNNSENENNVF